MMTWKQTRDVLMAAGVDPERLPVEWTSGIDLSLANLSWADLRGAAGAFTLGYFGQHHAVAAGGYIAIGCERYTYDTWLERHAEIGRKHDYSGDEIADYGAWIVLAVACQQRIEPPPASLFTNSAYITPEVAATE